MKAPGGAVNTSRCRQNTTGNPSGHPHTLADVLLASVTRGCRLLRALEDHWIGDLIGVLSLFAGLWLGLLLGYGMGWQ